VRILPSLIIGLALLVAELARAQTPVAVVLDLSGQARVQAPGAQDAKLALLQTLPEGSVLVLAGPARVALGYPREVLELQGAGRYRVGAQSVTALDAGARVSTPPAPAAVRALTLVPGRVAQGAVRMRGADSTELVLVQPRGTQWERNGLLFQWQGPPGRQTLELIDDQGELVASAELDRQEWSAPPVLRLEEGRDYVWRVTVSDAKGAQREARAGFRLLPAAQRSALVDARPAPSATVAERIRYALALEQAGLQEEAQRAWLLLARERPALAERVLAAP
jgi:hypothetical protein